MQCLNVVLFEGIVDCLYRKQYPKDIMNSIEGFKNRHGSLNDYESSCTDFMEVVFSLLPWFGKHTDRAEFMKPATSLQTIVSQAFRCRNISNSHVIVALHILGFDVIFHECSFLANFQFTKAGERVLKKLRK